MNTEIKSKGNVGGVPIYCSFDQVVEVGQVKPNPRNPNTHPPEQIELLAKIIQAQGWRAPVTVSTLSGLVVRGHGRLMAAIHAWLSHVPVDYQHYDNEDAETADLIADNRIAELAEIDNKMLAELFGGIDAESIDVSLTGYTADDVADITAALADSVADNELIDPDDEVPPPEIPTTIEGDIWKIGRHRLICGDSTSANTVEALMAGETADLLLTDPPYNVNYEGKTRDALKIQNDSMGDADFKMFLEQAFETAGNVLKPGGVFYIWHAATQGHNFILACREKLGDVRQCLVWNKNTMAMGRQDYQWKHEPCLYGWKAGASHYWGSDRKQTTVLNFDKPLRNGEHPTMKPVSLFQYQIENSSMRGQTVLDTFGGSGTTLIAAESTGRTARLAELDPRFCDAIVKRYANVTGKRDIVLVRDNVEIPVEETDILD